MRIEARPKTTLDQPNASQHEIPLGTPLHRPQNLRTDHRKSGLDLPPAASASVVCELLYCASGAHGSPHCPVNSALGEWNSSAVGRLTLEGPYAVTLYRDSANTGNIFVQANLVSKSQLADRTPNQWISRIAFHVLTDSSFGVYPWNPLGFDTHKTLDLNLSKEFSIYGGFSQQSAAGALWPPYIRVRDFCDYRCSSGQCSRIFKTTRGE
jgi:hypothetical protein